MRNLGIRAADAAKSTADLIEGTVKRAKEGYEPVTRTNRPSGRWQKRQERRVRTGKVDLESFEMSIRAAMHEIGGKILQGLINADGGD